MFKENYYVSANNNHNLYYQGEADSNSLTSYYAQEGTAHEGNYRQKADESKLHECYTGCQPRLNLNQMVPST